MTRLGLVSFACATTSRFVVPFFLKSVRLALLRACESANLNDLFPSGINDVFDRVHHEIEDNLEDNRPIILVRHARQYTIAHKVE